VQRQVEEEDKGRGKRGPRPQRQQAEKDAGPTQVHITNIMDEDITAKQIEDLFKQIGVIKEDKKKKTKKIWIRKNKLTGAFEHEASVTYVDPEAAAAAVKCFNGSTQLGKSGKPITVVLYEYKPEGGLEIRDTRSVGRGRGRGRDNNRGGNNRGGGGGGRGDKKSFGNEDDWTCGKCQNKNWARRTECNRCKTSRFSSGTSKDEPSPRENPKRNYDSISNQDYQQYESPNQNYNQGSHNSNQRSSYDSRDSSRKGSRERDSYSYKRNKK